MSTLILEIRALEKRGNDERRGSYLRAGHVFTPGWDEYVIERDLLEMLQSDPWLEVRVLDERMQAAKKMEAALAAKSALDAEEAALKDKREKVNALMSEANGALDAVGRQPPPPAPEPATPFQDSMLAAMPSAERAKLEPKPSTKNGKK